jgi:hypothetical protein
MVGKTSLTLSLALIFASSHIEGSVMGGLLFIFLVCAGAFVGRSTVPAMSELLRLFPDQHSPPLHLSFHLDSPNLGGLLMGGFF